jgi:hypothetical protein
MYVLSVQYSCAVVSVFLYGGEANLVLLTLFYSTLLALSGKPLQTDGRMDGWTEERINHGCAGRTLTGSSRLILVVLAAP